MGGTSAATPCSSPRPAPRSPALLDALDAADARASVAERERDVAVARLSRIEAIRDEARATLGAGQGVCYEGLTDAARRVVRERDDARAEVARLRAEAARARAEGFAEAVARAVAICDDEEAAGVAERARLVGEPGRHQLYDLSRQEGRYHAANRLRFAIEALRPADAEAFAVIERAVRQNEEVQRAEVARAVAEAFETCAKIADDYSAVGRSGARDVDLAVLATGDGIARSIRARGAGGAR